MVYNAINTNSGGYCIIFDDAPVSNGEFYFCIELDSQNKHFNAVKTVCLPTVQMSSVAVEAASKLAQYPIPPGSYPFFYSSLLTFLQDVFLSP